MLRSKRGQMAYEDIRGITFVIKRSDDISEEVVQVYVDLGFD